MSVHRNFLLSAFALWLPLQAAASPVSADACSAYVSKALIEGRTEEVAALFEAPAGSQAKLRLQLDDLLAKLGKVGDMTAISHMPSGKTLKLEVAEPIGPISVAAFRQHTFELNTERSGRAYLMLNQRIVQPNCSLRAVAVHFPN
jgi:hypothetical protein